MALPQPCKRPRCPNPAAPGKSFCEEHDQGEPADRWRGSAKERGYDAKWRKVRDLKLARDPFCERCEEEGKATEAKMVHHIVPLDEGGARLDERNLRSLCWSCHTKTHNELEGVRGTEG